jgi:AraC-like DNA-binding protein/CheY-like chemotaxis protein
MRSLIAVAFFLALCLSGNSQSKEGQGHVVQDTLNNRLQLLTQLYQAGNYEQAQVEAEWFREFLKRHKHPMVPKGIAIISGIYQENDDDRSATRLLADAELDARHDPNPESKAALLTEIVKACKEWELPEQALACQQMLEVARDSMAARQRRSDVRLARLGLDSLLAVRAKETLEQSRFFHFERSRAYIVAGVTLFALLALLFANFRNTDRWRHRLAKKEEELEFLSARLRTNETDLPTPEVQTAVTASPVELPILSPAHIGEKPGQMALVVEPNRQIVLYLKSLLADRFQIETAATANEGMQMAHDLLPDLIVCDAILNGKTGIELARQIKMSDRTDHIPVVLLSEHYGNEGKLDALRAGADAWFTRPVLGGDFDVSIQRLLDARKIKHELFSRFLHLHFTDSRIPVQDPFLAQIVAMVEQNLANPDFTAEEIARKMQLSKTHFTKKLKVLTGKEPIQIIREMRLEKAKVLLEKRAGTPQAISEMVGYSSPGSFALAFKDYFGENTLLLQMPPINRLT